MSSDSFPNNLSFRLTGPLILGVLVYFLILMFFDSLYLLQENFFSKEVFFTVSLSFLFNELNRLVCLSFKNVRKSIARPARMFLQLFAGVLVTALGVSTALYGYFILVEGFSVITTELITFNTIYFFMAILYHLYFFSLQYLDMRNDKLVDIEEQERKTLEAEVAAYKTEINPELLFNALEIVIQSIHEGSQNSDEILTALASVYRYRLNVASKELVSLDAEVTSIQPLLTIYGSRFTIKFENSCGSIPDVLLVPGTLLTLIEKALIENIVIPDSCFTVKLDFADDAICLSYPHCPTLRTASDFDFHMAQLSKTYQFYRNSDILEEVKNQRKLIHIPVGVLETTRS